MRRSRRSVRFNDHNYPHRNRSWLSHNLFPAPLPGPSQPSPSSLDPPPETPTKISPKKFADPDKGFTEGDKEIYQKYGLILPSEALQAAYENPETETIDDNIDEAIAINKSLGGKKASLMKSRTYHPPMKRNSQRSKEISML